METEDNKNVKQDAVEEKETKSSRKRSSASKPAKTTKPQRLVYIGPNLPRAGLSQYQIFIDGMPKAAEIAAETAPEINHLFVPVEKLSAARQALTRSGSREQRMYRAVTAAFNQTQ